MIRRLFLLAPLALCGCGLLFDHRPQLRFAGNLAAPNPAACPETRAELLIRDQVVTFAPDEGTWVLEGIATPGSLEASRERRGSDGKTFGTELKAQWTPSAVHGTYTTPRCTYRVDLAPF